MRQFWKKGVCLLLALTLLFSLSVTASAVSMDSAIKDAAKYIYNTVSDPQVGSVGGEWAVLGLARSGYSVPDSYYQNYYKTVEKYVKDYGGVLHEKKYTEYSRVIVALSAIGKDVRNVAGYDLTMALGDYDKTIWQGMNGPIWALIALDSANYPMPVNKNAKTQATRQMYIDRILDCQLSDGGWSLFGDTSAATGKETSDPDITGMALQALAKYQDQPAVAKAIKEALACMSKQQDAEGGFASWGTANSESCVQMVVALCELGISMDDSRFVKNGNTVLDAMMKFYQTGSGFLHTKEGDGSNLMASEQGLYALAAVQRANSGKNSLYRMGDALTISDCAASEEQPSGSAEVKKVPVSNPGKTFDDVQSHTNQEAIEAMAERGIVMGKSAQKFDPNANMTRAEYAAIVVRALGLEPKVVNSFTDVPASAWYASYVGTAYTTGIVNGVGHGKFNPLGTITRQEAASMVARAAKLCGLDTARNAAEVRDVLAQFSDYTKTASWARESLAFCYDRDILNQADLEILPTAAIKRCEIAQMLYNLLEQAELL